MYLETSVHSEPLHRLRNDKPCILNPSQVSLKVPEPEHPRRVRKEYSSGSAFVELRASIRALCCFLLLQSWGLQSLCWQGSDTDSGKPHHKHLNANQLLHALSSAARMMSCGLCLPFVTLLSLGMSSLGRLSTN